MHGDFGRHLPLEVSMDEIHDLFHRREYARAIPLLQSHLGVHPKDWNSWYLLGQAYRFTGDLVQAEAALAKSLALNDQEPPVYLAAGIVQQLAGRFDAALATFARANAINPDYHLAYNSAAFTYEKMGQLEKAQATYKLAIQALFRDLTRQADAPEAPEAPQTGPIGELWVEYAQEANQRFFKTVMQDGKKVLQVDTTYFSYLPQFFAVLVSSPHYPLYLRNRAKVLHTIGRSEEAASLEAEAVHFE
jgi:tetratricopeptide (TPR) repeat protein